MIIHDHYPVHTSMAVKNWFKNKSNVVVFGDWPRNFGDLMPLEQVWKLLAQKINECPVSISSTSQLSEELCTIWSNEIDQEYVQQVMHDIPNKLRDVVNCSGDWINE